MQIWKRRNLRTKARNERMALLRQQLPNLMPLESQQHGNNNNSRTWFNNNWWLWCHSSNSRYSWFFSNINTSGKKWTVVQVQNTVPEALSTFFRLQTSTHRLALFTIPYVSCLISLLNFFLSMIFLALSACLLGRSRYCISVLREWNKSWSLLSLKQEKIRSWFCCKKKIKWPLSLLFYCLITFRAAIRPHLLVINGFKIKKQLLSSFSVSLPEIVLIKIEIIWN